MIHTFSRNDFVGRKSQLRFLYDALSETSSGSGRTVVVAGDAGIGKTRLVMELEKTIDPSDRWFSIGHCLGYISTPYLPLTEILRDLFGLRGERNNALSACLKALLSQAALTPTSAVLQESEQYKRVQFEEIQNALYRLARIRALILVIEDVHWADSATLELLAFLIPRLRTQRILMIITCRTGLECSAKSREFLSRVEKHGARRINLPPLSRAEVRGLMQSVLIGHEPLTASLTQQIEELSEGNPLYTWELLKSTLLQLGTKPGTVRIPASLSGNVAERLHRLSFEQRRAVVYASAIGTTFALGQLAFLTGGSQIQTFEAIREAADLQLVTSHPTLSNSFSFGHEVVRQSIYQQLSPSETLILHERIALFFEKAADAPNRLDELAYHWAAADDAERAVRYNVLAAEAAAGVHAFADAARYYQRALHFVEEGNRTRPTICEKVAVALYMSGYPSEARHWIENAIQGYQLVADDSAVTRILLLFAKLEFFNANTEASATLVDRALRSQNPADPERAARAIEPNTEMARYLTILGRAHDARAYVECAEEIVKRHNLALPVQLHDVRALTRANLGQTASAFADFRISTSLAGISGDVETEVRAWSNLGCWGTWLGQAELAVNAYEHALALCEKHGFWVRRTFSALGLARTFTLLGNLGRARVLIEESQNRGISAPLNQLVFAEVCIPVSLMLGDESPLAQLLEEQHLLGLAARAGSCWFGRLSAALVELAIDRGQEEKARTLLHDCVGRLVSAEESWWALVLVAAYGYPSDMPRARALLDRSTTRRTDTGMAFGHLFRANVAARNNLHAARTKHALAAGELFKKLRWPIFEARALELSGDYREALKLYERHGSKPDVERIAGPSKQRPIATLTRRQDEIARLAVQGKSNRIIAKTLGISQHTVGHHMESIFNRLDISSRVQLVSLLKRDL